MPAALRFDAGVTLVGGGGATFADFQQARRLAPHVVAADGGANALRRWGCGAAAVVGDMDSLEAPQAWAGEAELVRLAEQDTTDLQKCLYAVEAPWFVGVGFTGGRLDHTLAALHAMAATDRRLVLLGQEDVILACPSDWRVTLAPGARVSFFPLGPLRGVASQGLRWPLEGLDFAPTDRIGTSNEADGAEVHVRFDRPGMVALLERRWLAAALDSLGIAAP